MIVARTRAASPKPSVCVSIRHDPARTASEAITRDQYTVRFSGGGARSLCGATRPRDNIETSEAPVCKVTNEHACHPTFASIRKVFTSERP